MIQENLFKGKIPFGYARRTTGTSARRPSRETKWYRIGQYVLALEHDITGSIQRERVLRCPDYPSTTLIYWQRYEFSLRIGLSPSIRDPNYCMRQRLKTSLSVGILSAKSGRHRRSDYMTTGSDIGSSKCSYSPYFTRCYPLPDVKDQHSKTCITLHDVIY